MFFTPELIQDTIKAFYEEEGIVLSVSEAERCLEGLGGLLLAYAGESEAAANALALRPSASLVT